MLLHSYRVSLNKRSDALCYRARISAQEYVKIQELITNTYQALLSSVEYRKYLNQCKCTVDGAVSTKMAPIENRSWGHFVK